MSRARWIVALACLACTRTGPSVAPEAATAAPSTAPTAPASPAAPGLAPAELPAWMRPLFDPGTRRSYAWAYSVPVHDEAGSLARASGTLRCRTDGPTRHALGDAGDALVSCLTCELDRNVDGTELFEPDFDDCYLATAAGLWVVDVPPKDEAEARGVVASPPYLPADPEPRSQSEARNDDGFESQEWSSIESLPMTVLGRNVTVWCRTDGRSSFYGENVMRCFAPEHGLVALEWDGRDGPSEESYSLVASEPLPAR